MSHAVSSSLLPRSLPPVRELADLFHLGHQIEPLEHDGLADDFDPTSEHFRYRFFRGCEEVPLRPGAERFEAANAWCLSDASLLAYVQGGSSLDTTSEGAARRIADAIRPSLLRLFAATAAKTGNHGDGELCVQAITRSYVLGEGSVPLQCYAADDGVVGIVAFRGTVPTSLPTWLANCRFDLVNIETSAPDVCVHDGFWNAASTLIDDEGSQPGLRSHLARRLERAPNLRFWFTGHSLGGALATLAAYRLRRAEAIYTYGSPRVGNVQFANAFSGRRLPHYRVVYRRDIVPNLPFPMPLLEYEHVGELRYLDDPNEQVAPARLVGTDTSESRLLFGEGSGFLQRFRESIEHWQLGHWPNWLNRILDHAPLFYSNVLWNDLVRERRDTHELGLR